jgi:phospho-N-acetylmuramoyl-pentapeptide-transferase
MLARIGQHWPSPLAFFAVLAIGAIVAVPVILALIAWQRRRSLGQQIYEDGPATHTVKQGTPTMGGLAFVAASCAGALIAPVGGAALLPLLCLVLAAAGIGFADDYLKVAQRRALGLRARAKFALLLLAACGFVAWESHLQGAGLSGSVVLRSQVWFGTFVLLPAWLWAILAIAAIVGAANAVNLTDGLDGLAAGTVLPPLMFLAWIYASALGAAVAGSCAAFFFFNRHPARIFMGDTGSLALGALLGGLSVHFGALLVLPLIGVVFVAEALSVIFQVASFKMTGRRIFKMSPLHHHFEMSGWSEKRVTTTFIVASLCATCATWIGLRVSFPFLGAY